MGVGDLEPDHAEGAGAYPVAGRIGRASDPGASRAPVKRSLAAGVLAAVLLIITAGQIAQLLFDYVRSEPNIRATALHRANGALNMLQSLHVQAMLHRGGTDDHDPVVETFDSALSTYAKRQSDVELWLVTGRGVAAWQRRVGHRDIELPKDGADVAALNTGVSQQSFRNDVLRVTRPIVMGRDTVAACGGCHEALMGARPGDVIGAYSARTTVAAERAAWWSDFLEELRMVVVLTAVGVLALSLYLRRTVLLPLARLVGQTELMARGDIERAVPIGRRDDEIAGIARALEDFRGTLLQKRALADYNAYLASHDSLTGLPNRRSFTDWLKDALQWPAEGRARLVCVVFDLDHFKHVNDHYGHEAGDALLRHVGDRMRDMLRSDETVARLGGDEFAAAKRYDSDESLADFLSRIETAVATPFVINGVTITPTAGLGYAVCPDDGARLEQLINNADIAMHRAKTDKQTQARRYDPDMDERLRHRTALAAELNNAVERGEIIVHYQAQNDTQTGDIVGYEALARWVHPTRGAISPAEFIPIAEETRAIIPIGAFVLREACKLAASQRTAIRVAVNVSAVQLCEENFAHLVHEVLVETGLSPKRLELELTETALVTNRDQALHVLRRLKALGVQIAIDDFGVGYSSLETINLFPVDKIKVDRSFVMAYDAGPKARSLLKAIMTIGESLQVPVLAEGVETTSQLAFLRTVGCAQVQGYLFDQPRSRDDLAATQPAADGFDHRAA